LPQVDPSAAPPSIFQLAWVNFGWQAARNLAGGSAVIFLGGGGAPKKRRFFRIFRI